MADAYDERAVQTRLPNLAISRIFFPVRSTRNLFALQLQPQLRPLAVTFVRTPTLPTRLEKVKCFRLLMHTLTKSQLTVSPRRKPI